MPTPVAKGIIIGVAALVAAGIAVYESPQFRRWLNNSRRKLAVALHHLGDEVNPEETTSPYRHDVSMTEEIGPAAEERRRIAREEIQRRRSVLEARQKRSTNSLRTFDTLVDGDGRLLGSQEKSTNALANSTAVDLGASQPIQRSRQADTSAVDSTVLYEAKPSFERGTLNISIPAPETRASSVNGADLTPVSEVSDSMSALMVSRQSVDEELPRSSLSSHTEGGLSEVIYAHPESIANGTAHEDGSPFSDLEGLRFPQDRPVTPPTPSTADNFSHIAMDASSDSTLSDFEGSLGRVGTPAGWSAVGSDVSSDECHRRGI